MSVTRTHPFHRDWQFQSAATKYLLARKREALLSEKGRIYLTELRLVGAGAFTGSRACSQLRADQETENLLRKQELLSYYEDVLLSAEYGDGCLGTVLEEIRHLPIELASELTEIADDSGLADDDAIPAWFGTLVHARIKQWVNEGWGRRISLGDVPESWLLNIFSQPHTDVEIQHKQPAERLVPDLSYVVQPVMPPGIENLRATPRRPGAPSGQLPH